MSSIVIVDTSVLLNIMDVPSRNQHKQDVLNRLGVLIEAGDHLFIPMAAIVEVGNHIAQVKSGTPSTGCGRTLREGSAQCACERGTLEADQLPF